MLRILSDLHLFDGASRIRGLRQLDPLTDGVDGFLINGDSCDTQVGTTPEQVAAIRAYFASRVPSVSFVTGNHDPDISNQHEQLLADGRVWATHGDVFFPDSTPWSRLLPELRRRIRAARAADPAARFDHLATRLRIFRQVHRGLPREWDLQRRDPVTRLRRLVGDLGSPLRLREIFRAWRQAPELAAQAARSQRQTAQVIVFGHVHRPSIAHREGRVLINTGAFTGPFGAFCVELAEDAVRVRPVEWRRHAFHPGRPLVEIPLAARAPVRISSAT